MRGTAGFLTLRPIFYPIGAPLQRFCRSPTHRTFLCIALFVLVSSREAVAATELGHPITQDFTTKAYEGDPINFAGVQVAAGLMYFGNSDHLHTYDGATWDRIDTETGHYETRGLTVGPDGVVYVGAIDLLGCVRDTPEGKKFISLRDQLPLKVRKFPPITRAVTGGDTVCFATKSSLLLWRNRRFTILPQPDSPRRLFAADGKIYVQTGNRALQRLDGEKLIDVTADPRVDGVVFIAAEPPDSLLLVTGKKGLFVLRDGQLTPQPTELDGQWDKYPILNARRLPDGSLALAVRPEGGGGVIFLSRDGRFLNRLDETNGLPRPVVYNLVTDRENGLWLCLLSGLARVEAPAAISVFDASNGLRGGVSELIRHDGTLWACTTEGLFRLIPGTPPVTRAHFERVLTGAAFTLIGEQSGLLIATAAGVMQVTAEGGKLVVPEPYGAVAMLRSALDPSRLWIGTTKGLRSVRRTSAGWQDEGFLSSLEGQVRSIIEEADGKLWLGVTGVGFVRVQFVAANPGDRGAATVTVFQGTHGLSAPEEQPTVSVWRGRTVFSGYECDTYRFDEAAQHFTPLDEVSLRARGDKRYSPVLGTDYPDHLWVQDVSKDTPNLYQLTADHAPRALLHVITATSNYLRHYLEEMTPDGPVLWVGGSDSLVRINLNQSFVTPMPFNATVHAKGLAPGAHLPPNQNAFDFEVSAPRFKSSGYLRFKTRLTGYENSFTDWTTERKRTFTNLSPGSYRFEVVAQDADYELSTPGVLEFTILEPWWRTWWFLGLSGLTSVGTVAGVTRWLANRELRRRVALLEAQSAVERERLRLARDLHDEIGSGLGRVILFAGEARRVKDDPVQLDAALHRVRTTAQDLVQHARQIVWAVSPQNDTLASLVERFGDYTVDTLRAAGIACRLDVPVTAELPPVAIRSEMRHSLFLALKEAVHNCIKYSGAREAVLTLRLSDGFLEIILQDHGRGFFAGERQGSGHGLHNLRLRAEALGGSGSITSEPSHGTTVRLRVPVSVPNVPPA